MSALIGCVFDHGPFPMEAKISCFIAARCFCLGNGDYFKYGQIFAFRSDLEGHSGRSDWLLLAVIAANVIGWCRANRPWWHGWTTMSMLTLLVFFFASMGCLEAWLKGDLCGYFSWCNCHGQPLAGMERSFVSSSSHDSWLGVPRAPEIENNFVN